MMTITLTFCFPPRQLQYLDVECKTSAFLRTESLNNLSNSLVSCLTTVLSYPLRGTISPLLMKAISNQNFKLCFTKISSLLKFRQVRVQRKLFNNINAKMCL